MRAHAFVAMPFGTKPGPDGQPIDFDRIYAELIRPALPNTALSWGVGKVRLLCLWNGWGGDGPGGTAHMYNEVKRRTGRVTWIDARNL